jgi:hypothetical protein
MAYVQQDNEVDGLDEMFRISDDINIFSRDCRRAIQQARDVLDDFLAEAWEFEDEIASEDLKVARFDEIAEAIAQATGLEVYLVGDCLTVIAGAALPNDEYHDDIHDILVRYFLED